MSVSSNTAFGHQQPQLIVEGVRRKTVRSEVITFKLSILRLLELTFIVPVPFPDSSRIVPVYVRFALDRHQSDKPGTPPMEFIE